MPEAAAVILLLALAGGVIALRAVLDALRIGVPASLAVLAPVSEVARALRTRPVGVVPVLGGAGLLAASVLRVVVLPVAGPTALGVAGFVAADVLWWIAGALLVRGGAAFAVRALAVEAPLLLALAVPVVAGRQPLPLGVEAPVALILLVVGGVLLPWAVAPRSRGPLVRAGLAAQPVSAAAVAAALLLPTGTAWLVGGTVVLAALAVLAERRFPVLPPRLVARLSVRVLLPLAAAQLAVVVALTLLA